MPIRSRRATRSITVREVPNFDDPGTGDAWDRLLTRGDSNVVFLTREWLKTWWDVYGRGRLLLLAVEEDAEPIAFAPLFVDEGMIFFVGSGGSDYLDFVGDIAGKGVMEATLAAAIDAVPNFVGAVFYHVPDSSRTGSRLADAAATLGLVCLEEGELPAPRMHMSRLPEVVGKKSLVRHENFFRREGGFEARHMGPEEMLGSLDEFFDQHVDRWAVTDTPSLFLEESHRAFYRALASQEPAPKWLRFTRIGWKERSIAFHYGFSYRDTYMWYKPSFAIDLAKRSPGEVLLRQLLFAARDERAQVFDFGLGDEPFKQRFASAEEIVRDWGIYPAGGGS